MDGFENDDTYGFAFSFEGNMDGKTYVHLC